MGDDLKPFYSPQMNPVKSTDSQMSDLTLEAAPTKPFVIGISGGPSSGRSYFAGKIKAALDLGASVVNELSFYKDVREPESTEEPDLEYNFEVFEAIDYALFENTVDELIAGRAVSIPNFDRLT